MKTPRIYLDTSVFGGCFDDEFAKDSLRLMEEIKAGKFRLVLSSTVTAELSLAPSNVWDLVCAMPAHVSEEVVYTAEMAELKQAYLDALVVGPASALDAEHIAIASVVGVSMIVSWNFKHIVHYEKIAGYHSVNIRMGYGQPGIYSPKEVVSHEG
jgi:predicted nucleic acid-binding protein